MDVNDINEYVIPLDEANKSLVAYNVAEKGIEKYLSLQLVYIDCSRIINGRRMMQTIGYPYRREVSFYLYALNKYKAEQYDERLKALLELHQANLEYEKEHPPVWYGGKKAKAKFEKEYGKHPRRRNVKEATIPGMGKEISNVERLKRLSAQFGPLNFKIKLKTETNNVTNKK